MKKVKTNCAICGISLTITLPDSVCDELDWVKDAVICGTCEEFGLTEEENEEMEATK